MKEFIYDREIETIKRILGSIYKYHDFSMFMIDEDVVAGFEFSVYTRSNIFEINQGIVDRLERYVNQFEVPVTIEIEEENLDVDYSNSLVRKDGKTFVEVNLDNKDDKIVVTNLDRLIKKFEG